MHGEKNTDLARGSLWEDIHTAPLLSFTNIAPFLCEKRVLKWDLGICFFIYNAIQTDKDYRFYAPNVKTCSYCKQTFENKYLEN